MHSDRPQELALVALTASALFIPFVTGSAVGSPASAVPDDGPGGINNSTFQHLWSEDVDQNNLSVDEFATANVSSRTEFERRLALSTDIPFETPPKAVETWNDDDFTDFSAGGRGTSVHPQSPSLVDDRFIKDAYVDVFAVQPSTIRLQDTATHLVAPDGEVLTVSDYRIDLPEDVRRERRRVTWSLVSSSIDSIELSTRNRSLDSGSGHQATLAYSSLSGKAKLRVDARISATVRKVTEDCRSWDRVTDSCKDWRRNVQTIPTSVRPTVSRNVSVNRLDGIQGNRVEFEGDQDRVGAVIHPDTAWSEISIDGDVRARSSWWFYTAGKSGWHEMVSSTEAGSSRQNSSIRPLQVYAYPSREEPYVPVLAVNGSDELRIEETWGRNQTGPVLPSNIDVDVADPFENADSIALTSTELDERAFQAVTVQGLVRGQSQTVALSNEETVRETNLSVSFLEANSSSATLLATVSVAATGSPVTTGNVTVGNATTSLNASGMAVLTVTRPSVFVQAEYSQGHWWHTTDPLGSSSTVARPPAEFPRFEPLVRIALVTLLWFFPVAALVLGFDYVTHGAFLGLRDT